MVGASNWCIPIHSIGSATSADPATTRTRGRVGGAVALWDEDVDEDEDEDEDEDVDEDEDEDEGRQRGQEQRGQEQRGQEQRGQRGQEQRGQRGQRGQLKDEMDAAQVRMQQLFFF